MTTENPPPSASSNRASPNGTSTDGTSAERSSTDQAPSRTDSEPLLSVEGLRTRIQTDRGTIAAVDGVSFTVDRGETVCLVGESGSGKSVTCQSLTGIVPQPPAEIVGGSATFDSIPLLEIGESRLRKIRGDRITHVFQNPQQALDPVYSVGDQIVEAITIHRRNGKKAARERALELLTVVGIPQAPSRIDDYPHEFSGGQRQRIAIAIALAAEPDLVLADEPTTAVDVTVQARLIELLRELGDDGMSILLVTHDLRVVASLADRVLVMFGGTIIEQGSTKAVFENPAHPYTQALFQSYDGLTRRDVRTSRGEIPTEGCRFRLECPYAIDECAGTEQPEFREIDGERYHTVSCVHYAPDGDPEPILSEGRAVRLSEVPR